MKGDETLGPTPPPPPLCFTEAVQEAGLPARGGDRGDVNFGGMQTLGGLSRTRAFGYCCKASGLCGIQVTGTRSSMAAPYTPRPADVRLFTRRSPKA